MEKSFGLSPSFNIKSIFVPFFNLTDGNCKSDHLKKAIAHIISTIHMTSVVVKNAIACSSKE